ncbi:ribonuclease E/G [Aestuariibius insulae]|uniref:ribonuclease E/G n=1 Tax=Aestuariibius insulae TaxID=2058287 RepID=UPI00345F0963
MKGTLIILDHLADKEAAALMVDGILDDILIDSSDNPRPGAIFRAICDRPLKGQGGMMVRLPDGTGFLRQAKGLAPGQAILVQVTGYAEPGKAVPVTSKLIFKSRFVIVTPGADGINVSRRIRDEEARVRLLEIAHATFDGPGGLILRSAAAGATEDELTEDIVAMSDLAAAILSDADGSEPEALTEGDGPHGLAWRDWTAPAQIVTEPSGFRDHGVLDALEDLRSSRVPLAGGHMFIEPTRALVAVDVNTGADTSPAAGLKANLSAARALPRALRLRGLGGQITVDFAPMSKAQRRQVESALRAAFRADPIETALVGWTPLGHYELQRKRERRPLDLPETL